MSGFAKLTVKALRALAEEYEIQLPAGRITKNGLIKILQSENIQPPWDGPEWECPTPASLMKAGLLLGIAPRSIWRAVQARWPDYQGEPRGYRIGRSLPPGSPETEAVALSGSPDHSGRSGDLGWIAGDREGGLAPIPPPGGERLPGFGWGAFFFGNHI